MSDGVSRDWADRQITLLHYELHLMESGQERHLRDGVDVTAAMIARLRKKLADAETAWRNRWGKS